MISDDQFLKNLCSTLRADDAYSIAIEALQKDLDQQSRASSGNTWAFHHEDSFDSQFYECKVGKADHVSHDSSHATQVIQDLTDAKIYDYIVFRIPSTNIGWIHALETFGALTLDVSLHLAKLPISDRPVVDYDLEIISYNTSHEREIIELSKTFSHGRFFTDPQIKVSGNKIYETWINNALLGKAADYTYLAMQEEKICGFISLKNKEIGTTYYTSVALIAKDPTCTQKGLGQIMLEYAMTEDKKSLGIVLNTQITNLPALRAYTKAGYRPFFSETIMGLRVPR